MSNRSRKNEERSIRKAHQNNRKHKELSYFVDDENYAGFSNQLATLGLTLKDIPGDGNCLFRALADQLEGNSRRHLHHREETVRYMVEHRADFEPFVEDDCSFNDHVYKLRKDGTYAGNDAIVAFARNNGVNVVIHQLNAPMWTINGNERSRRQLHIAYHNGDHYSSVRKLTDDTDGPTNIKLTIQSKHENKSTSGRRESKKKATASKRRTPTTQCMQCNVLTYYDIMLLFKCLCDNNQPLLQDPNISQWDSNVSPVDDDESYQAQWNDHIWDHNGTGTRIFGNAGTNVQATTNKTNISHPQKKQVTSIQTNPNTIPPQVSNKHRKEQARKERKKRSDERKKNSSNRASPSDSDDSSILVKNIDILKI
uniref:OTU domain-containing protein 3 n=1 Tax=Ciona intestinalis TaxID=7719 RepID=H2XX74_CIOIN